MFIHGNVEMDILEMPQFIGLILIYYFESRVVLLYLLKRIFFTVTEFSVKELTSDVEIAEGLVFTVL